MRTATTLRLYCKDPVVRYCSKVAKSCFLDARLVQAVWCELQSQRGEWKPTCFLLSTDTLLTPEQVIESYSLRWSIKPIFHQLKLAWGLMEAWQQSRQSLHRWVRVTMIGYGLTQLLRCIDSPTVAELCRHLPWRVENPQTADQIRKGLVRIFRHVAVRQWWNSKCGKFEPPNGAERRVFKYVQRKSA